MWKLNPQPPVLECETWTTHVLSTQAAAKRFLDGSFFNTDDYVILFFSIKAIMMFKGNYLNKFKIAASFLKRTHTSIRKYTSAPSDLFCSLFFLAERMLSAQPPSLSGVVRTLTAALVHLTDTLKLWTLGKNPLTFA